MATAGVVAYLMNSAITTNDAASHICTDVKGFTGSRFDATLNGSGVLNLIYSAGGDDTVNGRGGNDAISGNDGDDTLVGGADTYDLPGTPSGAMADVLDGIVSRLETGMDMLLDVENVIASSGADEIIASNVANVMPGGDGEDIFVFGPELAVDNDRIPDFEQTIIFQPGDTVDLSAIDANGTTAGNDALSLIIGSNPFVEGSLMFMDDGGADVTLVQGNTDTELTLTINGKLTLTVSDFDDVS
ncbi:MAG: hypothetical protein ACR2O4_10125 [Hyphomicrobiaceae bacterium]